MKNKILIATAISSTVAYILKLSRTTVVNEINLSPLNKVINFK